MIKTTR